MVNSSFVREHERGGKHAGGEEEREMHAVHGWEKALELAHVRFFFFFPYSPSSPGQRRGKWADLISLRGWVGG